MTNSVPYTWLWMCILISVAFHYLRSAYIYACVHTYAVLFYLDFCFSPIFPWAFCDQPQHLRAWLEVIRQDCSACSRTWHAQWSPVVFYLPSNTLWKINRSVFASEAGLTSYQEWHSEHSSADLKSSLRLKWDLSKPRSLGSARRFWHNITDMIMMNDHYCSYIHWRALLFGYIEL